MKPNSLRIVIELEPESQTEALEIISTVEDAMRSLKYSDDGTLEVSMNIRPRE